mgnify:CR=1
MAESRLGEEEEVQQCAFAQQPGRGSYRGLERREVVVEVSLRLFLFLPQRQH